MPKRPIRDIIRDQQPVTVPPDTKVRAAALLMREKRVGAVLVTDGGLLVGIFTERDALCRVLAAGLDPDATEVRAVMTRDPATATPDQPFAHALHTMNDGGFRHLPVVQGGRAVGMVSIRDAIGFELVSFERDIARKEAIAEILG